MTLRSSRPVFWRVPTGAVFFIFESARRLVKTDPTEASTTSRPFEKRFLNFLELALLLSVALTRVLPTNSRPVACAFHHVSTLSHRVTSVSLYRVAWFVIVKRNACDNRRGSASVTTTSCTCGGAGPIQRTHSREPNS